VNEKPRKCGAFFVSTGCVSMNAHSMPSVVATECAAKWNACCQLFLQLHLQGYPQQHLKQANNCRVFLQSDEHAVIFENG
jgi:hypothetical protein